MHRCRRDALPDQVQQAGDSRRATAGGWKMVDQETRRVRQLPQLQEEEMDEE